jgi:hypothetical protein
VYASVLLVVIGVAASPEYWSKLCPELVEYVIATLFAPLPS